MKHSLSKRERITINNEFKSVFFKGFKSKFEFFEIRALNNLKSSRRLGISVSQKTGNPVLRNKIKRIIREWFRLNKQYLLNSHDFIFIVKKKLNIKEIQDLKLSMNNILNNVNLLK